VTTTQAGLANVDVVRAGYKALDEGAMDVVLANWHPDAVYYGFDGSGSARVFRGTVELFAMLAEVAAEMETFTNELLAVEAVGSDMVVCRVRAIRTPRGGAAFSHEFVQVFRMENGRITLGVEMIGALAEQYYKALAGSR
jgi:ketosteroid isomerase-like protein